MYIAISTHPLGLARPRVHKGARVVQPVWQHLPPAARGAHRAPRLAAPRAVGRAVPLREPRLVSNHELPAARHRVLNHPRVLVPHRRRVHEHHARVERAAGEEVGCDVRPEDLAARGEGVQSAAAAARPASHAAPTRCTPPPTARAATACRRHRAAGYLIGHSKVRREDDVRVGVEDALGVQPARRKLVLEPLHDERHVNSAVRSKGDRRIALRTCRTRKPVRSCGRRVSTLRESSRRRKGGARRRRRRRRPPPSPPPTPPTPPPRRSPPRRRHRRHCSP